MESLPRSSKIKSSTLFLFLPRGQECTSSASPKGTEIGAGQSPGSKAREEKNTMSYSHQRSSCCRMLEHLSGLPKPKAYLCVCSRVSVPMMGLDEINW